MATIKQGTTPTLIIKLNSEVDLTYARLFLSISQNGKTIRKDNGLVIDGQTISAHLSQSDTIWLIPKSPVIIDLNWVFADGSRGGIVPIELNVIGSLLKEVVE